MSVHPYGGTKPAADPNEAIPFHVLFGATLENGDLATNYDAARVETYINSHLGLA